MLNPKLFLLGTILIISLGYISASGISLPSSIVEGSSANITISLSSYNNYVYFYPQGSTTPVNVNLDLGCSNVCKPNTYSYTFSSDSFPVGNYLISVFSQDPSNAGWVNSTFAIVSNVCTASVPALPDGTLNYYVGGAVNGPYGSGTDACLSDGKTLDKYYCSGMNVDMSTYICPNGCSNGYCLPAVCTGLGQTACGSSCCDGDQTCNATYQCTNSQSSEGNNPSSGSTANTPSSTSSSSTCSDGTPVNQCSPDKPYYCNTVLGINSLNYFSYKCSICGCPSGATCSSNF